MPRHQDNVDVIITSNPRPNRFFSAVHELEVPAGPREGSSVEASWWKLDFQDAALRTFTVQLSSGQAFVYAMKTTPSIISVFDVVEFGRLRYMQATPPASSKFTWLSTHGHEVSLELAAWIDGAQSLDVRCVDANPSNAIWTFDLELAGTTLGKYEVDYSKMQSDPKSPGVATFAIHQPYR